MIQPIGFEIVDINHAVAKQIKCFPIAMLDEKDLERIAYEDSFLSPRSYGGDRKHMGVDIMDTQNKSGELKILSMTDGLIENLGWLELGGYRIGIRTDEGVYFYYAHLDSYEENIKIGDHVQAGQTIGAMGSTGYGVEGTNDQFPVHLHLGISVRFDDEDYWLNPYSFLQEIEELTYK